MYAFMPGILQEFVYLMKNDFKTNTTFTKLW